MSVVVKPAYQPDEELVRLVDELTAHKLSVLVVNDGSDKECDAVFNAVSEKAVVIHSEKTKVRVPPSRRVLALCWSISRTVPSL